MTRFITPAAGRAPAPPGGAIAELLRRRSRAGADHGYLESSTDGSSVTYGELAAIAVRWWALLDDLGVAPGATVGLAVQDPLEFSVVFLAAVAAGRTVAPLDPAATDADLVATCARTAPGIVFSDRGAPEGAAAEWVTMPRGALSLARTSLLPSPDVWRTPGGVLLSTSGTTGVPKVIRLDEAQLLHTARSVAAHFELSAADRGFSPLPLFHINAEVVGLLATLVSGATLVLDDRFHRSGFWAAMASHDITWINAVPAILSRLATLEDGEQVPDGVRFARSASAPLPVPVLERFERATGIPVVETYGMTEAASQITANPLSAARRRGSVGRPVGTEVRIRDERGERVGPGEVGQVGIRGPGVIRAYACPGYDDRFDADGWLETGDLGYLDGDGYVFLVGRVDDVINRGGEKVYPKEVEDALIGEPGVAAVAVVGWDHEVLGRVPVAYLVADGVGGPDDVQRAAELVARVQERSLQVLSRPKRPVAFHVVERFPRGATGKVRLAAVTGEVPVYSLLIR